MVAEDRQVYTRAESALGRLPVHVEIRRVAAGRAVLEHVPPPWVLGARNRHMIRHNIEHLTEPITAESLAEVGMGLRPAEFLIKAMGIHDIIAVQTPPTGLEIRRAIEVSNP
jgi:hypothetical protein